MSTVQELQVFVVVDAAGDYAAAGDEDGALEAYDDAIGGNAPRRLVRILLTVPLPEPITLKGEVPPESTEGGRLQVVPLPDDDDAA